jgi:hypothetical protein
MLRDAVLYRMLLLGEIASALPDGLRDLHPEVAWRQIRAFRNLAIHQYFGVDWAVVWKIAQEEPTVLEKQGLAIINAEYPELADRYEPGSDTASLPVIRVISSGVTGLHTSSVIPSSPQAQHALRASSRVAFVAYGIKAHW